MLKEIGIVFFTAPFLRTAADFYSDRYLVDPAWLAFATLNKKSFRARQCTF